MVPKGPTETEDSKAYQFKETKGAKFTGAKSGAPGKVSPKESFAKARQSISNIVNNDGNKLLIDNPQLQTGSARSAIKTLFGNYEATVANAMKDIGNHIDHLGYDPETQTRSLVSLSELQTAVAQQKNHLIQTINTAQEALKNEVRKEETKAKLKEALKVENDDAVMAIIASLENELKKDKEAIIKRYDLLGKDLEFYWKELFSKEYVEQLNKFGVLNVTPGAEHSGLLSNYTAVTDQNFRIDDLKTNTNYSSADGRFNIYQDKDAQGNFKIKRKTFLKRLEHIARGNAINSKMSPELECVIARVNMGKDNSVIAIPKNTVWPGTKAQFKTYPPEIEKMLRQCALFGKMIEPQHEIFVEVEGKQYTYEDWLKNQFGGEKKWEAFEKKVAEVTTRPDPKDPHKTIEYHIPVRGNLKLMSEAEDLVKGLDIVPEEKTDEAETAETTPTMRITSSR